MSVKRIVIEREQDDPIAKVRISLGRPKDTDDFYVVFRGEPEEVINLLEDVIAVVKVTLPAGHYKDKR